MADQNNQQVHPAASPRSFPAQSKHDEESAAATVDHHSDELRRRKRIRLAIYIVAFIIFQIGVITIFSVTVIKVKNPNFRMTSTYFEGPFRVDPQITPAINLAMETQFEVKNTNFGPYKFDTTNVTFLYRGIQIASATIPKSKANFRSTKKINLPVSLVLLASSDQLKTLKSDLGSGILPLTSQGQLSGKVELMLIMKKKKVVNLDCTMDLNTNAKAIQNLKCT